MNKCLHGKIIIANKLRPTYIQLEINSPKGETIGVEFQQLLFHLSLHWLQIEKIVNSQWKRNAQLLVSEMLRHRSVGSCIPAITWLGQQKLQDHLRQVTKVSVMYIQIIKLTWVNPRALSDSTVNFQKNWFSIKLLKAVKLSLEDNRAFLRQHFSIFTSRATTEDPAAEIQ